MTSVSKASSRSLSSGFSSFSNDQCPASLTLQTVINVQRADINVRAAFCGEQDCRLNELRHMTGAIIDLNVVQGTTRSFERVSWTISHRNSDVRDFVARRLNSWMQQAQLACDMANDDVLFRQEQHGKQQARKGPPSSAANFGSRQRTRSLTQTNTTNFHSSRESVPSTPSGLTLKRDAPFTGLLERTLMNLDAQYPEPKKLFSPQANRRPMDYRCSDSTDTNVEMTPTEIEQLMESARWAGVLSDVSDPELDQARVCFADTIALSRLAQMLRDNELKCTSDPGEVDRVIQQSTINVTSRKQNRQFDGQSYWFHRIVLDNHILFPVGISLHADEARRLAYRHMIDVCLSESGVKMKMLSDDRVKVVKGPVPAKHNRRHMDDLDTTATYLSTNDLSCLSYCKMAH